MTGWLLLLSIGCDADEGVIKESREVIKAIEDGKSLKKIGKQAQDVVNAIKKHREEVQGKLDKADAWVADKREKLNLEDADLQNKLQKLEDKIRTARQQLSQAGEVGEDIDLAIEDIEEEIDALLKSREQ